MLERNISLDILKLVMALMVVAIHGHFLLDVNPALDYLFVSGLFRIAVPVFMIINGFYFYDFLQKNPQNIKKYLKRIFILYVVWSVFYSVFIVKSVLVSPHPLLALLKNIVLGYHHLWYLSGLLCAAIMLYLFRQASSKFLIVSLLTTFIIGVAIQHASYYHLVFDTNLSVWAYRNFLFLSYPFLCIGYLIAKHNFHHQLSLKFTGVLLAVGLSALVFETYFNYTHRLSNSTVDNDILLSLMLAAPVVFIFFIKQRVISHSKEIALYATAIYLIHPFVGMVLSHIIKKHNLSFIGSVYLFVLVIFFSIILAYFLIKINKKFRFIL